MGKIKKMIGILISTAYFIVPLGLVLLILIIVPLMFLSDVGAIRNSGFAGPDFGLSLIGISGLVIGLSLLIPTLRKPYALFPWLYPFVKIFFISMIILTLAVSILNYGYQEGNPTRHNIFFGLMIGFVVVGRICMSLYFKWRPINIEKEGLMK